MELLKCEPSSSPLTDIHRQIQELDSPTHNTLEGIALKVITVPQVSIFGEVDHIHRPRGSEMIEQAQVVSIQPSHFVMEIPGDATQKQMQQWMVDNPQLTQDKQPLW